MKQPVFRIVRVSGSPVKDDDLLTDLKRVAESLGSITVPQQKYGTLGTYDYSTLIRHFGSWNKALLAAGLSLSNRVNIADKNFLKTYCIFGNTTVDSRVAGSLPLVPQQFRKHPIIGVLARGHWLCKPL